MYPKKFQNFLLLLNYLLFQLLYGSRRLLLEIHWAILHLDAQAALVLFKMAEILNQRQASKLHLPHPRFTVSNKGRGTSPKREGGAEPVVQRAE